jgi:hypothetical protein
LIQENILRWRVIWNSTKKRLCSVRLSNLEFYKNGASKTNWFFCELTGATQNERVSSAKFQEQERSKLFFISLKQVAWTQYYQSFLCFVWIRGWNPLKQVWCIVLDSWTKKCRFITKTQWRKNYSVTRKQKLLSDALLMKTTSALEENLDFIA